MSQEKLKMQENNEQNVTVWEQEKESPIIGKTYEEIPEYKKKHLYLEDDNISYKEVLKYGFPTYQYAKRAFYKHKGIENWEEEKLEIPSYLEKQGHTGKFFKTGLKALPTGENIVVIDVDTVAGKPVGSKNFSDWLEKNRINQKDFNTFSVRTASGGLHFYYTYPSEYVIKISASEFLPHVDIRAEGGIIMMPGSKAKKKDGSIGSYEITPGSVSYIKPIPQKLLEAICEKPKNFVSKCIHPGSFTSTIPNSYKAKVQESIVNAVSQSAEGTRNHVLHSQSVKAGSYGLPYEETLNAILQVSSLPSSEIEATYERGYEFGTHSPAEIPETKKKVVGDTNMKDNSNNDKKIPSVYNETFGFTMRAYSLEDIKFFWDEIVEELEIRYIMEEQKFIMYNSKKGVWERVNTQQVSKKLTRIRQELKKHFDYLEQEYNEDCKYQKSHIAPKRFVEEGMVLLRSLCSVSNSELDTHPDEMVVKNGILHLKDGTLRPFAKEELHTKASAYKYLSKEEYDNYDTVSKKRFEKILSVLDADTLKYVQTIFGQAMTGHQSKTQKSYWFYSTGQSGKSTLLNLFGETILEWTGAPNGNMFAVDSSRFIDADAVGKRLWVLEEAPAGYLDAGKMKKFVGTRFAQIEKKGVDTFREEGVWTMFFAVNNYPLLRKTENNHGTKRRICMIPFLRTITKNDPEYDPSMDTAYNEPEMCELFLHWVVEGAKEWYENPLAEDSYSLEMLKINADFQNRADSYSDPMHDFFQENIVVTDNTCITLDDLFKTYQDYCYDSNIKNTKSKIQFKRDFEERTNKIFEKKRPGKYEIVSSLWVRGVEDNKNCMKQKMFGIGYANMANADEYI